MSSQGRLYTGYSTLPVFSSSHGLPPNIPDCATSGHLGHAHHRHPGEGEMLMQTAALARVAPILPIDVTINPHV